jgi:spore maturation protein CgeB
MKVLFVAPYYGPVHSSGRLWVKWLQRLGCEVTVFDYRQAVIPERWYTKVRGGRRLQRFLMQFRLLQVATQRPYDLIFVLKGETIYPSTLARIRKRHKGLIVNWMGDADPLSRFPVLRFTLPFYDIFFTLDRGLIDNLRLAGAKHVEHLPYGCDPEVHRSVILTAGDRQRFGAELCYVGYRDHRDQVLANLLKQLRSPIDLKIWGYQWERTPFDILRPHIAGGALNEEEMVKAFNAAKIVLNLQPTQLITGVNFKTHEISGSGAFQLTDFKEEVAEMYEPGKEIVVFRSPEEIPELVERYLRDEKERRRIAEASQKRAYNDHTLEKRARKLLEIVREA